MRESGSRSKWKSRSRGFQRSGIAAFLLLVAAIGAAQGGGETGCLYAFSVGVSQAPVGACGYEDPRKIGEEPRVRQAMDALGIPLGGVIFRGCVGHQFSASPDTRNSTAADKYFVTYPADLPSSMNAMVAPIVHELAHIAQMRKAQGLDNLRKAYEPRRIELGADFIAGLVFAKIFANADFKDFLLNLSLIGSYRALDVASHGTPEQRSDSFRRGAFVQYPYNELPISRSEKYFQENDYARIVGL